LKVALYARVSTDDKDQHIETQVQLLERIAKERDYEVYRQYLDDGFSGGDLARKGMGAMRRDAKAGKFDAIMAQSDDRLFRDTLQSLIFVNEMVSMKPKPIGVILVNQGFNLADPNGMTAYEISAVFSSHFRRQNSQKVKQGLERARSIGHMPGRPKKSFDIEAAIYVIEHGGFKGQLAGDLGISQATLNEALHKAGRDDLVKPDLKRCPVHHKRGAENLPSEIDAEYIKNASKPETEETGCFMQGNGEVKK
jgi:DNA invertase Pin-like site-specific DNA recombinase